MDDLGKDRAIRRKLGGARGSDVSALRALRLALSRAAGDLFGLALAVLSARQDRSAGDDIGAHLPEDRLLLLLDGPGGLPGAVCLDLALVTALIQAQTLGQVSDRPPEPRDFTHTDAALCAPLLDAVLARVPALVEGEADRLCLEGYRFGAPAPGAKALALSLSAPDYRIFDLTLDIEGGRAQGLLRLVLADRQKERAAGPAKAGRGTAACPKRSPLLDVPAELTAVLGTVRMPLARIGALRPGDLLPLAQERLDGTVLRTPGAGAIARGQLGRVGAHRAVRLFAPDEAKLLARPLRRPEDGAAAFTSPDEDRKQARLPAPQAAAAPPQPALSEEEERELMQLSPEEAAERISDLAGLGGGKAAG